MVLVRERKLVRHGFFSELPPSDNHLYTNGFKGRRVKTTNGRNIANHLKSELLGQWMHLPALDQNVPYGLVTVVFLSNLLNETFGRKGGTERRYKKLDASNRGKLIEDVVSELIGVDDSSAFDCLRLKRIGEPHAEVYVYEMEEAECLLTPDWLTLP